MGIGFITRERAKDKVINIAFVASLILAGFFVLKPDRSDNAQEPQEFNYKVVKVEQLALREMPVYKQAAKVNVGHASFINSPNLSTGSQVGAPPPDTSTPQPYGTIQTSSTNQGVAAASSKKRLNLFDLNIIKLFRLARASASI